jgi:GDPmannose 4,6-dehydratase
MKALIFGANGQDGYYLSQQCKEKGIEVIGISRTGNYLQSDVSNYEQVEKLIKYYAPGYVFHLAANSTTRHDALFENHSTISTGTLNILEASYKHNPKSIIFITGSGLQFENHGNAISENDLFAANNAYCIPRIQSVYAARYYRSLGLKTYVGYLFHHESSLRKPNHISKKIILAAQRIAKGSNEKIEIGDLHTKKEWTFAGDTAKGILRLIEQDNIFEAVIGSGVAYTIENWLEECFKLINHDWRLHVNLIENFISEYTCLLSNPKTINYLGWKPSVNISQLAKLMINNQLNL